MRKQRLILEIEKRKYREDIDELDKLKNMLEKKKQETNTGFSELAESNKDMQSLKSGSFVKQRGYSMSREARPATNNHVIKEDDLQQEASRSQEYLASLEDSGQPKRSKMQLPNSQTFSNDDEGRRNSSV